MFHARLTFASLVLLVTTAAGAEAIAGHSTAQETALKELMSNFTGDWHRSDAHALSMFWVADGDFTNPSGQVMHGRAEIEAFYAAAFAHGYSGSTATASIENIRFVRPDVAIIDGTFQIVGAVTADHQPIPPETGRYTVLAERVSGKWWIIANREMEPPVSVPRSGAK
jgi:uncharacterized protein (TIGR02246 family)